MLNLKNPSIMTNACNYIEICTILKMNHTIFNFYLITLIEEHVILLSI